jgi:DNA-3-methyladenine glycosylase
VVTNKEEIPHAVLIRAIKPLDNKEMMLERTGKPKLSKSIGDGPGKVSALLGIHFSHSGSSLLRNSANGSHDGIWIEDRGIYVDRSAISAGPRIGVEYAGKDAELPYRFRTEL